MRLFGKGERERTQRVTRVEVVDHRADAPVFGRALSAWNCVVALSYQDDGRTLKVFVSDAPEAEPKP